MTVTKANFGDKITSAIFNENTYYLLKGTAGYEDTVRLADNVAGTLALQPNSDPNAPAQLFQILTANGTLKGAWDSSGNLIAAGTATVNGLFAATATINTLSVPTINTTNVTNMTAGTLVVSGEASINTLFASTATIAAGDAALATLRVSGTASLANLLASTATIAAGDAALNTLRVSGQASVNTLMASGAATFAGNVNVEGTLTAVGALSYTNLTITGTATINSLQASGDVARTAASGLTRGYYLETNSVARWAVVEDSTAESGGNAGSNFAIDRFDDTGVLLGSPFGIARPTGIVTMGNGLITPATASLGALQVATGGTNNVMVQITEVTGQTGSFTISNIPNVYQHLLLLTAIRSATTNTDNLWVRFNNDSGSNYIEKGFSDNSSNAISFNNTVGANAADFGAIEAISSSDAGSFSHFTSWIYNANSTQRYKTVLSSSYGFRTGLTDVLQMQGVVWKSLSAVSSLVIVPNYAFDTNSIFTLYGIP